MRSLRPILALVVLLLAVGAARAQDSPAIELVETWPIETSLDNPHIPDAHEVWLEMIEGATESLDFAEFYASTEPGSRLEPIIEAIEAAASRGVKVRFLAEDNFYKTYPETLDRLDAREGIEMRRFKVREIMGGVLHAKYFIVDGDEAFLGSQNFDWRALEHIQELGVRFRTIGGEVRDLRSIFDRDWELAGGSPLRESETQTSFIRIAYHGMPETGLVASPRPFLPRSELWDLPELLRMIDSAQERVRIQLLSYKAISRDGEYWDELESALRRAAARKVQVEMLLSHWSKRASVIKGLQSLQCLDNITVKIATIPEWSGGYIPFARVVHAKYMVVDGKVGWIGTSNWEKSYFHTSRNVGLVVSGESFANQLDAFFLRLWDSEYVETVDPGATYPSPQYGERR